MLNFLTDLKSEINDKVKEDKREVLKKLATNCRVENFNYGTQYHFQTVYHKSAYSYCMCRCGLENELIGYIDEDGSFDDGIFESVVQSILDGRCEHVTGNVPKEWIRRTIVSAAHIAVASGTKLKVGEVVRYEFMTEKNCQGIFNQELYAIALLKKRFELVSFYYKIYIEYFNLQKDNSVVLFYKRQAHRPESVVITALPRMIAFLQMKDSDLLEYLLTPKHYTWGTIGLQPSHFEEALQYAWRYNLTEAYETLLISDNLVDYDGYRVYIMKHLRYLTMYDLSEALAEFLDNKPPTNFLLLPCYVLDRPNCKEVLAKYRHQKSDESKHLTAKNKVDLLICLLGEYLENFKDEILSAFKKVPNYRKECKQWLLDCNAGMQRNPDALETLLAFTLSEDDDDDNKEFVEQLIKELLVDYGRLFHSSWIREKLKVLLKLNTATDYLVGGAASKVVGNNDILDRIDILDRNDKKQSVSFSQESLEEFYELDVKEHGIFGFDGTGFALNFARPFLLDSGVEIPRQTLERDLETRHPAECDYILKYLDSLNEPKRLANICRNTLRGHFRGPRLYKYLDMTICPSKIRDFILMNYSLLPNPRVSFKMNDVARKPTFGETDHVIAWKLKNRPGVYYN